MKIKKDDKILVISGKYRGKIGKVLRVFPRENKIIVEGVNFVKKHLKPRRRGEKGRIVSREAPFPLAKAKVICPACKKPARLGFKIVGGGKKRICKKCQQTL